MGRIRGHYEWDDDELTPGRKKEGGLHQNLYDVDGNVRGHARFVPDEGSDQPPPVTRTVYIPVEERRQSLSNDVLVEHARELLSALLYRGLEKAKPVLANWWSEAARPVIRSSRARLLRELKGRRKADTTTEQTQNDAAAERVAPELSAEPQTQLKMSVAEAEARYLAAVAARAYSDEQMRLVSSASIMDIEDLGELERLLAKLPPSQLQGLVAAMATNPALLADESLAQLASVLSSGPREIEFLTDETHPADRRRQHDSGPLPQP